MKSCDLRVTPGRVSIDLVKLKRKKNKTTKNPDSNTISNINGLTSLYGVPVCVLQIHHNLIQISTSSVEPKINLPKMEKEKEKKKKK